MLGPVASIRGSLVAARIRILGRGRKRDQRIRWRSWLFKFEARDRTSPWSHRNRMGTQAGEARVGLCDRGGASSVGLGTQALWIVAGGLSDSPRAPRLNSGCPEMRFHQTTTRDLQRRSNADLRSDPVALPTSPHLPSGSRRTTPDKSRLDFSFIVPQARDEGGGEAALHGICPCSSNSFIRYLLFAIREALATVSRWRIQSQW
jgi:hypothetical protein